VLPTLAEIKAVPARATCVSLFSGAGGSCTGLRRAGFQTLYANEFVPPAAETYAANWPDTVLDRRDVRRVSAADILAAVGRQAGAIDLLEGSPPCASFSAAGKRQALWGQAHRYNKAANIWQRTDDLFDEYLRLLEGLRPKTFWLENVVGLLHGASKGIYAALLDSLRALGYAVEARIIAAEWLGVPQERTRLVCVGVRRDLGRDPAFPSPLPYRYSLRDALPHVMGFVAKRHGPRSWQAAVSVDAPAPTIATQPDHGRYYGHALVLADGTRRPLSLDEAKRLCTFPPDYVLTGGRWTAWERLGRAVPPAMAYHLGRALAPLVLDEEAPHGL
jgi:DNA (cytosine-5)-methyltransferase 1